MKYDDASWHYGSDFPKNLPKKAGATHIGMFLAWALINDFASMMLINEYYESLQKLKNKEITGSDFLIKECDEKFTDEELNEEGNLFTQYYFNGDGKYSLYLDDYDNALCANLESIYCVEDSWENYDKLALYIDAAYENWKNIQNSPEEE